MNTQFTMYYYSYRYGPELEKVYMSPNGLSLPVDRIMKAPTEHTFGWSPVGTQHHGLLRPITKEEFDMLDAFGVKHIDYRDILDWERRGIEPPV